LYNDAITEGEIPIPIIAAIAHYQFATIHPYYGGNGRTARILTTLILHMNGYALKGIYALEEYYAVNLPAYYNALTVGDSHNYYMVFPFCFHLK
jgi:Fic family protein